jgi:gliding motility-associated peptidyl-prolyl isomerase
MLYRIFQVVVFLLAITMVSCNRTTQKNEPENLSQGQVTAKLLEANKASIAFENEQIVKLIASNGWKMSETPTGLRYQFIEEGSSVKSVTGQLVTIEYEVKLISNEVIYSSEKNGPKVFRIGSGGVESGLEEGILLLGLGDKARFIFPSYLAHGLSGDQDRIPPKATLIYTVKVINLK